MRVERASCAIVLTRGIDMQHELRHLAPVRPLRIRIEHSQIRCDVLLIVHREHGIRRGNISNFGICGRFLHERVTERMILTSHKPKWSN